MKALRNGQNQEQSKDAAVPKDRKVCAKKEGVLESEETQSAETPMAHGQNGSVGSCDLSHTALAEYHRVIMNVGGKTG